MYWKECIEEAFDEANITAENGQVKIVVEAIEGAHENYSMAHGYDNIPNPLVSENENLKKELKKEQEKVVCEECKGKGSITDNFGLRSSTSRCSNCNGLGRL